MNAERAWFRSFVYITALVAGCATLPEPTGAPHSAEAQERAPVSVSPIWRPDFGSAGYLAPNPEVFCNEFEKRAMAIVEHLGYLESINNCGKDIMSSCKLLIIGYSISGTSSFLSSISDHLTAGCFLASFGLLPACLTYDLSIRLDFKKDNMDVASLVKNRTWRAWLYLPFFVPAHADLSDRAQDQLLQLLVDALNEAKTNGFI